MKAIFLHIGYNKTGTTAIQKTFFKNRKLLVENNLFYPSLCRGDRKSNGHHSLAESLLFYCKKTLPPYVNLELYRNYSVDHYWKLLHTELAKTRCSNIFISSEAFSRFVECESQIEYVKYQLKDYSVKILIYIRDQIEYFESAYNQAIKHDNETCTIQKLLRESWLSMSYNKVIEQWANIFGEENIIVRVYDKSIFPNGVVTDILQCIGFDHLTDSEKFPFVLRSNTVDFNPRLPNNMVGIKRLINILFKLTGNKTLRMDDAINPILIWLGRYFKDKDLLTENDREIIQEHMYVSNNKLGEKYFNGVYPFKNQNNK
jgi:hypothetical protein